MNRTFLNAGLLAAAVGLVCSSVQAEPGMMRAVGNISVNKAQVDGAERPFFADLAKQAGIKTTVQYNPMDVVGINGGDALRLLRSGAFDVMSVQIGMAARDDPFFEGIDLIGTAPSMQEMRKAVDAYRDVFDERLQKRFNAKVLTLWPFGEMITFCNAPLKAVSDISGQKVRVFTSSMASVLGAFGATPVSLQLNEVYPALQRGVVDCGVVAAGSAYAGKWHEVTTHVVPMSLGGAMQGHFVSLKHWNQYDAQQQQALLAEFKKLEDRMWQLAVQENGAALDCMTGKAACQNGEKLAIKRIEVAQADYDRLRETAQKIVLPNWAKNCNAVDPQCSATWNRTVGQALGLQAQ